MEVIIISSYLAAVVGANLFTVLVGIRKPWKISEPGSVLFQFMLVLTITMDLSLVFRYWDSHEEIEDWIQTVLFLVLAGVIWRFVFIILRARYKQKQNKK